MPYLFKKNLLSFIFKSFERRKSFLHFWKRDRFFLNSNFFISSIRFHDDSVDRRNNGSAISIIWFSHSSISSRIFRELRNPDGREQSGSKDGEKREMRVSLRRRTIFGRKSNESDSRSIIPVSSLWRHYASEENEGWKRTRLPLIPAKRGRVDGEDQRKSSRSLD